MVYFFVKIVKRFSCHAPKDNTELFNTFTFKKIYRLVYFKSD